MTRYLIIFLIFLFGCEKEENKTIDKSYPEINMTYPEAFPKNCDTLYTGSYFVLNAKLSDNKELGSYNIDIHNNFDHHSHSTEVEECVMFPEKTPVNPFLFIQQFTIPEGVRSYNAKDSIFIPDDVDTGNYHLMIKVTDHEGWQSLRGISIYILD